MNLVFEYHFLRFKAAILNPWIGKLHAQCTDADIAARLEHKRTNLVFFECFLLTLTGSVSKLPSLKDETTSDKMMIYTGFWIIVTLHCGFVSKNSQSPFVPQGHEFRRLELRVRSHFTWCTCMYVHVWLNRIFCIDKRSNKIETSHGFLK